MLARPPVVVLAFCALERVAGPRLLSWSLYRKSLSRGLYSAWLLASLSRVCVVLFAARILQPQYAFINLNPFEVLQLHHTATDEEIKVRYRKVRCLLVGCW